MLSKQYYTKSEAVYEITQATGYGKFIVERKIHELIQTEKIQFIEDPGDNRRKLLNQQSVQMVIDSLTLK